LRPLEPRQGRNVALSYLPVASASGRKEDVSLPEARIGAEKLEGGFLMALCTFCNNETKTYISCTSNSISIGGKLVETIRWGDERFNSGRFIDWPCQVCGTPPGGTHHCECCLEQCPACFGHLISCVCVDMDDEPYDDEDGDAYDDDEYDDNEREAAKATTWTAGGQRATPPATPDHHWRTHARCTAHVAPGHYRT
jgi:hypothetical protein